MSAAAVAAVPPPANPPVRKLYRHALESIFAFGSLSDLHSLLQVSREWGAAVMTMSPTNAPCAARDPQHLERLLVGSLRRHVSELHKPGPVPLQFNCNLGELERISLALPWMRIFRAQALQLLDSDRLCTALSRFTALRHLTLYVEAIGTPTEINSASNRVIETIGQLRSIDTLELAFPDVSPELSCAPLRSLPQLRVLDLVWYAGVNEDNSYSFVHPLTDAQIGDLCAISSLDQLLLPLSSLDPSELVRLCPPSSTHCWTRLNPFQVTSANVSFFAALPLLTSLDVTWRAPDCSALTRLVHLTDLSLGVNARSPIDAGNLTQALKTATRITRLKLISVALTSSQLEEVFLCMPLLASLSLRGLWKLEGLRCFSVPSLAASLTSLTFGPLPGCPSDEVEHLLCLRSLVRLTVPGRVFATPIRDDLKPQFVRSDRFPTLEPADFF